MNITKTLLRRLIKEAIHGHIHGNPDKDAFLDVTMLAISSGDYEKAANAIMNSYMVDDTWPEEEQALVDMLVSASPSASPEEIERLADSWIQGHRDGTWVPKDPFAQEDVGRPDTAAGLSTIEYK
jgi:hypothetical protein